MSHIDGYVIKIPMAIGINLNDDFISSGCQESYDSVGEKDKVIMTDNSLILKDFKREKHSIHIMDHHGKIAYTIDYESLPAHLQSIAHHILEKIKEII